MVLQPAGRSGSSKRFWSVQMLSEEQVRNSDKSVLVFQRHLLDKKVKRNCLTLCLSLRCVILANQDLTDGVCQSINFMLVVETVTALSAEPKTKTKCQKKNRCNSYSTLSTLSSPCPHIYFKVSYTGSETEVYELLMYSQKTLTRPIERHRYDLSHSGGGARGSIHWMKLQSAAASIRIASWNQSNATVPQLSQVDGIKSQSDE